jgi:hypothetical protein
VACAKDGDKPDIVSNAPAVPAAGNWASALQWHGVAEGSIASKDGG